MRIQRMIAVVMILGSSVLTGWASGDIAFPAILGMLGLPLFHNGMAGIGVLLGPSGGYLIGFIFAALITGLTYEHDSRVIRIGGIAVATGIIYLFGVAWLMYSLQLGFIPAVITGVFPFIPGDMIKAAAAYLIGQRLP